MYNPFSLAGKTILLTGASSGIGRATAIECSKLGANTIIVGRNRERLQEAFDSLYNRDGQTHYQLIADLTDTDDIQSLVGATPQIDGLVQAAGKGLTLPIQFASKDKLIELFDINFFSQVELLRHLFKQKKLNKDASVVLIASIGGTSIFNPGNGPYGSTKAALNAVMKYCAKEFSPRRIRVNSVALAWLTHHSSIGEQ